MLITVPGITHWIRHKKVKYPTQTTITFRKDPMKQKFMNTYKSWTMLMTLNLLGEVAESGSPFRRWVDVGAGFLRIFFCKSWLKEFTNPSTVPASYCTRSDVLWIILVVHRRTPLLKSFSTWCGTKMVFIIRSAIPKVGFSLLGKYDSYYLEVIGQ